MRKIIKYVLLDILRNRMMIAYTLLLFVIAFSVLGMEDSADKGLASLLQIVLIAVPLVSIVFSSIYYYNSSEFIELLVSQPVKRKTLWLSLFTGLASSMCISFCLGVGIPVLLYAFSSTGVIMLLVGTCLNIIFVSIALLAAVRIRDKAKGIGMAILLWFYFSLIFDALVLFLMFQLSDYPIENYMLALTALNPVDLGRVIILLKMDVAAMMGYTGAIFKQFFGDNTGSLLATFILMAWAALPLYFSLRKFNKKDL